MDFDREREGLTLSTHPKGGGMRSSKRHRPAYAALDLGTNNCRLLVARPSGPSFNVIDSFSRI
ncbi:MAG: hypothetical protein ACKVH0_21175, partial [Alphaproteobacteria bacterium]